MLAEHRPDVEIGIVVEDRFKPLFTGNPSISAVLGPTWREVRKWAPKLVVNLHGGTTSLWMTLLSGARFRAGFAHHSFTFAYNLKIGRAQRIMGVRRVVHTAEHLASAFFALGVPQREIPRAQLFAGGVAPEGRYAVLHPFASSPDKVWPCDRFCELARYLKAWNIEPIFVASPSDDASAFEPHRIFRGSLEEVKGLLSQAALFVGNDSGPAHMAAAFGVRTIVLFGPSRPDIWGPWQTEHITITAPEGLQKVPVSRVVAAVDRLCSLEEAHA
jgi:heptosyltransferase III